MDLTNPFKYILALVAGALGTLAFAPLILVVRKYQHRDLDVALYQILRFYVGFIYGLGLFGSGVSWISISMTEHGGASITRAHHDSSLRSRPAVFPELLRWVTPWHKRWSTTLGRVCLLTSCWVTMEALRSWFLTGFPWLLLGYSAIETPFEGIYHGWAFSAQPHYLSYQWFSFSESDGSKDQANVIDDYHFGRRLGTK